MLRDTSVSSQAFVVKFDVLKKKLDVKEEVSLDSDYHQQLKAYIERLHLQTCQADTFNDKCLDDIRDAEMSNLNRLQKLKNGTSYKKDKHKRQHQNEDWG